MTVVAIIQARMGSSRLPGKVLADIAGRPMLDRVVARASRARRVDRVVVATTTREIDAPLCLHCERAGIEVFRGPEDDVLERYRACAEATSARVVVRITSDCPLLDPQIVDRVIEARAREGADYCSNFLERRFPRGLDVEAFGRDTLETTAAEASEPHQRAHVTPYVFEHPTRFRLCGVAHARDESGLRWTVDTDDDLRLVRAIYAELGPDDAFGFEQTLELVRRRPELARLNAHVEQKKLTER